MTTKTIKLANNDHNDLVQALFSIALGNLKLWINRAQQRRHLSELTAEQLNDIGISITAAADEVAKPMWRA